MALISRQILDLDSVFGEITGQNQCLLELQIVVFLIDAFIFIVFAGQESI